MTRTGRVAAIGSALLLSAGVVGLAGHGIAAAASSATPARATASAAAGGPGKAGACAVPPSRAWGPCPPPLSAAGTALTPDDVAQALGITFDQLRQDAAAGQTVAEIAAARGMDQSAFLTKLQGIIEAQLAPDVSGGTITAAEEAAALQSLQQASDRLWNGVPGRPPRPRPGRPLAGPAGRPLGPGAAASPAAVAEALGITAAELRQDLAGGKSVAQIASAQGVSETAFESSLKASVGPALDAAVAAGRITSAQASADLSALEQHWWSATSLPGPMMPPGPRPPAPQPSGSGASG